MTSAEAEYVGAMTSGWYLQRMMRPMRCRCLTLQGMVGMVQDFGAKANDNYNANKNGVNDNNVKFVTLTMIATNKQQPEAPQQQYHAATPAAA
jgi:hypothetical protein